jgi:hypothetical protein
MESTNIDYNGILNSYLNSYLTSQKIKDYNNECTSNYQNLLSSEDGKNTFDSLIDPIYLKIRSKICDPSTMSTYVQNIADLPDNAAMINQLNNKLDTIVGKLDKVLNYEEGTSVNAQQINSSINSLNNSWYDTKTIILVVVLFVLFIVLGLSVLSKCRNKEET